MSRSSILETTCNTNFYHFLMEVFIVRTIIAYGVYQKKRFGLPIFSLLSKVRMKYT